MNKYFIIIFLFLSLIVNAQKMGKVDSIDISYILSCEDFQEIKQFVLDKGQTRTYCNMYNNNPYYEFNDRVELYLNSVVQFPKKEDVKKPDTYDTIVILIWNVERNYPFRYTHMKEDASTKKIYLIPSDLGDTSKSIEARRNGMKRYITNIQKEVRQ